MSKAALEKKGTKPEEMIYQTCERLIKK